MSVSSYFVVLFVIIGFSFADPIADHSIEELNKENAIFGAEKCSQVKGIDNTATCVAMNALQRLEDISSQESIQILPGIILSSDVPIESKEIRKQRTMELPKTTEEKISKIFDMMMDIMNNIFTGRTLKIKFNENTTNSVMRAFEEGRGKMKKLTGPLMMALGAKMIAIIPIMLGGLALFAAKALIISKVAFVLAIILGAQYLVSNGANFFNRFGGQQGSWGTGGGGGSYGNYGPSYAYGAPGWSGGWNTATSQSYPYARSMEDAQDLAYAAYK